jgi:hypothetical protein
MTASPKASPGIVAAAIVALIGSGLSLLLGLVELTLNFASLPMPPGAAVSPGLMKFSLFLAAAMSFGFGAWGIASGLGLLRLKNWARLSTIVYSGILVGFAGLAIWMVLIVPLPPPPAGQFPADAKISPQEMMHTMRIVMAAVYLIPALIGVWWLIFFNRPKVKSQFTPTPSQPPALSPPAWGAVRDSIPAPSASRRPLSLSIIGWYMIAVGFLMLPAIPFMHFPALVLGWTLTGRPAMFFYLLSAVITAALGYGILELKPISRPLAIAYFLWAAVNSISIALWPGHAARMQSLIDSISSGLNSSPAQAAWSVQSAQFGFWIGAVSGTLFSAVIIWFLIREKSAFASPHASS